MKIKKLPAEARSKLQSGIVITDAVQCVLELVHNSLDAKATAIAVRIDLKNYQIQVVDNGTGMGKEDLELVGERFMTSKFHNLDDQNISLLTYGFKGQAISSLLDVCKSLTIETKSSDSGPTFIKVFENNKALPITVGHGERSGTGTTVTIKDFMCNMPVRRKRINNVFDTEDIKIQLQYLAVIHYDVCFTLRNENKGIILFQKQSTSSVLLSISSIYGKNVSKFLKPINLQDKHYEISGFVSVKSGSKINLQLVYINRHIVTKSIIHKFVNNLMKVYFENKMLLKDSLIEKDAKKLKSTFSNTFIVLIKCSPTFYEFYSNIKKNTVEFKNVKEVLKHVHKAIRRSLKFLDDSLDSSLDIKDLDKNNEDDEEKGEIKTVFGTSLLLNVVKGDPVNRLMKKKSSLKKNKKEIESKIASEVSSCKNEEKSETWKLVEGESVKSSCIQNLTDCMNDSFESPIPRNQIKSVRNLKSKGDKNKSPKESFEEFCKWLKVKFETDKRAFDLYNEFLQSNESNKNLTSNLFFKSPVLGRKLKKRKVLKNINTKKPENYDKVINPSPILPPNDEVLNKKLKFQSFPKGVEIENKGTLEVIGRKNFDLGFRNVKNHTNNRKIFKNPYENSTLSFYKKHVENYKTFPSPASSEYFFTNIIQFRNLSESFGRQTVNIQNIPDNSLYSTVTNSWRSHYEEASNIRVYQNTERREYCVPLMLDNQRNVRCNKNFGSRQDFELGFDQSNCPKKKSRLLDVNIKPDAKVAQFKDAGIQANMSDVIYSSRKNICSDNNALHKKSLSRTPVEIIPEIQNFENENNSFNNNNKDPGVLEVNGVTSVGNNEIQEVPNPDFWNFPTPEAFEREPNNLSESSHVYLKKSTSQPDLVPVDKGISSSELVCCGQKTNTGTKTESDYSAPKEAQTIATMWADCLKEIDDETKNFSSRSLIEDDQLPKTIPVEELCDFSSVPVESTFCLSERHEFVPKGLSPKTVTAEALKITHLSPREKSRIKCAINNSEIELLASVKWQEESTGGSIKPTIPDGILDEMRQKAERNMIYYENEILSASLSYCAIKVHNLLHSFAFTKELLSGVEIIGQLDKKFIVTKMNVSIPKKMSLVSLFDQHAVDERIKLEELMQDYVASDGRLISRSLNVPIECVLNEFIVGLVSDLDETLLNIGLNIKIINEKTVSVFGMPSFLLDKHEKNVKNKKDDPWADIRALVVDMINEIIESRGMIPKVPKTIHDALCSEACHNAVKFNKMLTKESMMEMINKLKNCRLPFQCAHGRPSVIPIIDLEDFKSFTPEYENVNRKKIKEFMKRNRGNYLNNVAENSGGVE